MMPLGKDVAPEFQSGTAAHAAWMRSGVSLTNSSTGVTKAGKRDANSAARSTVTARAP